jgi:hypothetical protein
MVTIFTVESLWISSSIRRERSLPFRTYPIESLHAATFSFIYTTTAFCRLAIDIVMFLTYEETVFSVI